MVSATPMPSICTATLAVVAPDGAVATKNGTRVHTPAARVKSGLVAVAPVDHVRIRRPVRMLVGFREHALR
jgi:hypothetical protein